MRLQMEKKSTLFEALSHLSVWSTADINECYCVLWFNKLHKGLQLFPRHVVGPDYIDASSNV